jgi:AcrR family transcriptional regulator
LKDLTHKIQFAATQLFFRFGIKQVSMDDLSRKLKISKKTLYHCFDNKNELVKQTVHQHFESIQVRLNEISSLPISAVARMMQAAAFAVEELSKVNPSMIHDLHKYHPEVHADLILMREQSIRKQMIENIQDGREHGYYRLDFNAELISQLFAHQIIYITENWAQNNNQDAAEGVYQFAIYHLRGITTESGFQELNLLQKS